MSQAPQSLVVVANVVERLARWACARRCGRWPARAPATRSGWWWAACSSRAGDAVHEEGRRDLGAVGDGGQVAVALKAGQRLGAGLGAPLGGDHPAAWALTVVEQQVRAVGGDRVPRRGGQAFGVLVEQERAAAVLGGLLQQGGEVGAVVGLELVEEHPERPCAPGGRARRAASAACRTS